MEYKIETQKHVYFYKKQLVIIRNILCHINNKINYLFYLFRKETKFCCRFMIVEKKD